ncbi:hypothetical protein D770_24655 [Flammeovirgaceae bacterium 311]|nr:hypothetical protein D770_24655 [Flammeovirgaceae bacterium 311]
MKCFIKIVSAYLCLLLSNSLWAQDNGLFFKSFEPDSTDKACKEEMMLAENDFLSNNYTLKLKPSLHSKTQQKVLKSDFGVNVTLLEHFFEDCYNSHLKALLRKHFGMDVLERTSTKADSLDNAGAGNRNQQFKPAGLDFREYLIQTLTQQELARLSMKYKGALLYIQLDIIASGVCTVREININSKRLQDPIISAALDGKELYYPRIEDGQAVATWMAYPVRF